MALLHDSQVRSSLENRLKSLRSDATRKWGKMSVDQMLRHVNIAMDSALGRVRVERLRVPLPAFVLKFLVLNAPWPKGSPTAPEFVAGDRYDFEQEKGRCLALIAEVAARPLDADWPAHHSFGTVTGAEYSRLQAKHLDHHLRQFSA